MVPSARASTLFHSALNALALLGIPASLLAQSPFVPPYQGSQPELVRGAEDGLATGKPKVRHVWLAAPDTLAVVIDAQAIPLTPVQKYVKQPGDEVRYSRPQKYGQKGGEYFWGRDIIRDGKPIGQLHGPNKDFYSPAYTLEGTPLDLAWADAPASYAITSPDDPAYRAESAPTQVFRKTKPEVREWVGGKQESTYRHELLLRLPHLLTPGRRYQLAFKGDGRPGEGVGFTFDDARLRTETIHVNLTGHHPKDAEKIALAGWWLGPGGDADLSRLEKFQLVDDRTGAVAFTGKVALTKPAAPVASKLSDALPMSLYALDFSAFNRPGVYRIVIPGLGSSFPFRVDDAVWNDAAFVSAKGFYNQRASTELGPPFSKYKRPRNFHPADGFKTFLTDPAIFYDPARFPEARTSNPFKRIQASLLDDQTTPDAIGGWHDAADYDRSLLPQVHNLGVHALLDLHDSAPAYYAKLNLNIPESGNKIPDVIDEALWCMDLFLRLQQRDGGIPSAVESIEHPSEPSWLLTQPTVATPPTPATCHAYAAAAAQLSLALKKYDPARAEAYRTSALRAMEWAEKNPQVPNLYDGEGSAADQQANFAFLWMHRLTGEPSWHQRFRETFPKLSSERQLRPAAAYALTPSAEANPALQKTCRDVVVKFADECAAKIARVTFNLGPTGDWWTRLGRPPELIAAHRLTRDPKYLLALTRLGQFALGRNPQNASYTTGLGARQVVPFNLDAVYLGVPYPEGITTWGPLAPVRDPDARPDPALTGLFPAWREWPWAESYYSIRDYRINEYTVATNMAHVLILRAYLAQTLAGATPPPAP